MAGVDAAASFLLGDPRMAPRAVSGSGRIANFEILLEAHVIDGSSPDAKIVATRLYPLQ
jgi:hypothetical protein